MQVPQFGYEGNPIAIQSFCKHSLTSLDLSTYITIVTTREGASLLSVIRTDKWPLKLYEDPLKLCGKLELYFSDVSASNIYQYLALNGMYQRPLKNTKSYIQKLQERKIWELVKNEENLLKQKWNGPDIPIFILPADSNNRKIANEFKGKSGLAFKDKLFLFISEDTEVKEIQALFTHEYNHVCRLAHYNKETKDYVLLDTIILEGLAEIAVRERFGEAYLAPWTTYYSSKQLEKLTKNIILPNKDIAATHRKHEAILYGLKLYPNMLGYCTGYHIVKSYIDKNKRVSNKLLRMESEQFLTGITAD